MFQSVLHSQPLLLSTYSVSTSTTYYIKPFIRKVQNWNRVYSVTFWVRSVSKVLQCVTVDKWKSSLRTSKLKMTTAKIFRRKKLKDFKFTYKIKKNKLQNNKHKSSAYQIQLGRCVCHILMLSTTTLILGRRVCHINAIHNHAHTSKRRIS
jgi:hypothetical protein